jgi:hypothetical protein
MTEVDQDLFHKDNEHRGWEKKRERGAEKG